MTSDRASSDRASSDRASGPPRQRLLTFASGGWVLLLVAIISLALIAWAVAPALMRSANRPPGDNKTIESYHFDLSNLLVPRESIRPAMLHRDMVPVMFAPTHSLVEDTQKKNDPQYGKYLVPDDLVIGVAVNGASRAYPMRVLNVHEIVNDTLGGIPIAVTYNVPCDSVAVFDRRVDGRTHTFGVSGLVYNSNMLMYEKDEGRTGDESLWSQLQARAISGKHAAAGANLKVLPAARVRWADWHAIHPSTSVLDRDLSMTKRYADAAPTSYFQSEELWFPVDPLPPAGGPPLKAPILAVTADGQRRVYLIDDILVHAGDDDTWRDALGGVNLVFSCNAKLKTVAVARGNDGADHAGPLEVVYAFWFAWHAAHPEDALHSFPSSLEN